MVEKARSHVFNATQISHGYRLALRIASIGETNQGTGQIGEAGEQDGRCSHTDLAARLKGSNPA